MDFVPQFLNFGGVFGICPEPAGLRASITNAKLALWFKSDKFHRMNIALDRDVEDFLQSQVKAGVCDPPERLLNDLVRSIRDQQQRPFDVTPELEKWLLEAADKPTTPLTPADFAGIRERAQSRKPSES